MAGRSRAPAALAAAAAVALAVALAFGSPTDSPAPPPMSGADRAEAAKREAPAVLVYSRTAAFRHDSIPTGIAAIRKLGSARGLRVAATESPAAFRPKRLGKLDAVVFLNTSGDVLPPKGERALRRYVRKGGGFAGIHAASDTEYDWPFYGRLVGARFASHPAVQRATVHVTDRSHPSTRALPATWIRTDEWYDFRTNPRGAVHVLATLDETTYSGGSMGPDHPIAWCKRVGRGRSWYTAEGHTPESYAEPLFRKHLLGGILWAAGLANGRCAPN